MQLPSATGCLPVQRGVWGSSWSLRPGLGVRVRRCHWQRLPFAKAPYTRDALIRRAATGRFPSSSLSGCSEARVRVSDCLAVSSSFEESRHETT